MTRDSGGIEQEHSGLPTHTLASLQHWAAPHFRFVPLDGPAFAVTPNIRTLGGVSYMGLTYYFFHHGGREYAREYAYSLDLNPSNIAPVK